MNTDKSQKTILVSGASGIVGYGILKSLKQSGGRYRLIGTTIYELSPANYFCDIFEQSPKTNENNYLSWLVETIRKYSVDMIIPSIEVDVMFWKEHLEEIESATGVCVLLNNPRLIDLCADKWLFYEELRSHACKYAIPTTLDAGDDSVMFPCLLKPRKGSASKGIVKIRTAGELQEYKDEIGDNLMIQPIVGSDDEEYTVSAFFDKESRLFTYIGFIRTLSKEGFTDNARTVEIEGVEEALSEIAGILKPVGPTNFQFRRDGGRLLLLEINPRISSATSMRTAFGYNESLMSVEYFLENKELTRPVIRKGRAIRYTEDLVFYDSSDI